MQITLCYRYLYIFWVIQLFLIETNTNYKGKSQNKPAQDKRSIKDHYVHPFPTLFDAIRNLESQHKLTATLTLSQICIAFFPHNSQMTDLAWSSAG